MKIRGGVTFTKDDANSSADKDYTYFLLAMGTLLVTALLILGACVGTVYFFYRLVTRNAQEKYFQFDEEQRAAAAMAQGSGFKRSGTGADLEGKPPVLSKIEEEADEEY